jgi:hypothetical protein
MPRPNSVPRNQREIVAREKALAVVALMRRGKLSLSAAAKLEQTDIRTVRRYAATVLQRAGRRGVFRAKPSDRIARTLNFFTPQGIIPVTVRNSRIASKIAEYMNTVRSWANARDLTAIQRFRGKSFRVNGKTYNFVTDAETLGQLANAGNLSIAEGLYRVVQTSGL